MMKEINSQDNRIYKECIKLTNKKYRDSLGKYIIEGPNLVEEAMKENIILDYIVIGSEKINCFYGNFTENNQTVILQQSLYDKISQTENSQGIFAVVKKVNQDINGFCLKCNGIFSNILILDRLQDPGNIGTIIRTADAAGFGGVILLKGSGDVYSPKVVRAAAGSLFRVPLLYMENFQEVAALMKREGKKIVCTCFDTDKYYYDMDMSENIALVIGNEGNGISSELINLSDYKVKIPMRGKIDSLNAAVAAGILMYEASRKKFN